jgi:hypothetical protein
MLSDLTRRQLGTLAVAAPNSGSMRMNVPTVVLVANFNPRIFQPFWLAKNGLISEKAAETAEIAIIHQEVTAFSMESLFQLTVERNRFSIERKIAPLVLICGTTMRIFGDLLPHTPINAMGINRVVHFHVGEAERERIGLRLAPRELWGDWGKAVTSGEGVKHGGLQSLTLIQRNVSDRPAGWIQAKVEPSVVIGGGRTGIYVEVNDHYQLTDPKQAEDPSEMMKLLNAVFDKSIKYAESIIDQIMSLR